MPLTKLVFKPGVNKENTRYYNENGWYDSNRVRFRQGTPEQLGGWVRLSANTFLGLCRSLWNWVTLSAQNLLGVGTNKKFYIELGGAYNDVTPIRRTVTLTAPFTATDGLSSILVTDPGHQCAVGDYVTFSGAALAGLGGNITAAVLTGEFAVVTTPSSTTYTITVGATANATDAAGSPGGGTVVTQYQVNGGDAIATPLTGWGSGGWGVAAWGGTGSGLTNPSGGSLRVWNQQNYGEDLIYGPNGGLLYYWYARQGLAASTFTVTIASPAVATLAFVPRAGMGLRFTTTGALPTGLSVGTTYYVSNVINNTCNLTATFGGAAINTSGTQSGVHSVSQRGIPLSTLPGASDTPLFCNVLQTSDTTRFVFAMGTNDYGSTAVDPMLVRWSDQENAGMWTPAITNQSGSQRLSNGWKIVTSLFARQELLVWTTSALYSFQYLGPPYVWGSQLMGDNLSIISTRAAALASSVAYWMGVDKFYAYNGRVNTLRCDLRQYIFGDINMDQAEQFFAGTNEGFSEVWWFYCSASSDAIDRYVIYNYAEDVWYHGALARTAWLDTPLREFPTAATYSQNIVSHEVGTDDNETGIPVGMNSSITSSEFDIGDGHNFGFVWRMLPDMTFRGSTAAAPTATLTMNTLQNSGSGYTTPGSQGGSDNAAVVQTVAVPIEKYTGEVYVRVRGRQMAFTVSANQVGTTWQLGAPRIDVRGDGRKS